MLSAWIVGLTAASASPILLAQTPANTTVTPSPPVAPFAGGRATLEAAAAISQTCQQIRDLKAQRWHPTCLVRIELLQLQADQIKNRAGDIPRYLRVFSVSRRIFWSHTPPAGIAAKLQELEQASLILAQSAGLNCELPALGPPTALKNEVQLTLQLCKDLARDLPPQGPPPDRPHHDLSRLTAALANLCAVLESGTEAAPAWRAFNADRVRFLSSCSHLPQLERITQLLEALQVLGEHGRRLFSAPGDGDSASPW